MAAEKTASEWRCRVDELHSEREGYDDCTFYWCMGSGIITPAIAFFFSFTAMLAALWVWLWVVLMFRFQARRLDRKLLDAKVAVDIAQQREDDERAANQARELEKQQALLETKYALPADDKGVRISTKLHAEYVNLREELRHAREALATARADSYALERYWRHGETMTKMEYRHRIQSFQDYKPNPTGPLPNEVIKK